MAQKLWAGLDVGVETTSVCVVDDLGELIQETTCATVVKDIHQQLRWLRRRRFATVGVEASTSPALTRGLRNLGYSIELYETRQLSKFLRSRRNKTDAGDAMGIAEAGRLGLALVSKVHLKSLECQSLLSRLTIRTHLLRQRVASVNLLCRQIEEFGGRVRKSKYLPRLRERVEAQLQLVFGKTSGPVRNELLQLLAHIESLADRQRRLDEEFKMLASENDVCRRLMTVPGVGPQCALTFYAVIDEPHRFRKSSDVGCYLGLTPTLRQSGLTEMRGRISKMGNRRLRSLLVQASISNMKWGDPECALGQWKAQLEQRRGRPKARIALARKLAVIMLALWKSGENYQPFFDHERYGKQAGSDPDVLGAPVSV